MTNLRFYALKDERTGICSMFATAQCDEFAINFYVETLSKIFSGIKGKDREKNRIDFLSAVHSSKLVRLADIDISKPEVVQNLAFIADFSELVINDTKSKEKNENKENLNGNN